MALSEEQREIAPASVPSAQKPIAWVTTNEDGDYAMLFFDKQEARGYSGDDEPIGLAPVPSIAPQPEQENYKAQRDALLKSVAQVKSNLMHHRRFGDDTFQAWKNAAARAEGDLEEALASVKGGAE